MRLHPNLCTNQHPRVRLTAPKRRYASRSRSKGLLSMCPTTSAGLPKQTHSMTVFLPQRLGLESFLWAQAKSGEPQNGLAGSCRPSGQILTSLLRYHPRHWPYPSSPWVSTSINKPSGTCEIVSLHESACLILPKRGNKECAG